MKKVIALFWAVASILTACAGKASRNVPARTEESKVLVAYFSCTGNTKKAAEIVAKATGGTLYRITPQTAYTAADLNWHNENSRSSVEMKDAKARPALADRKAPVAGCDTIYLGYPIWWDLAPRIVNTFLESYDFKGKTVIPFVTSGSSTIAHSAAELRKQYPQIKWGDGKRFSGNKQDFLDWLGRK